MTEVLSQIRRTSKLGELGETLAAEALVMRGFQNVQNLNEIRHNQPYADLLAERRGHRFFIGVKTRNEERDVGGLNRSYNCVLVPGTINKRLKERGLNSSEITALALDQVHALASEFDAVPAWIAIPMRPRQQIWAAYFGLLSDLGVRRSIPMTSAWRESYECLADWTVDPRVTPELTNRK